MKSRAMVNWLIKVSPLKKSVPEDPEQLEDEAFTIMSTSDHGAFA
jgi:hypothetical protein